MVESRVKIANLHNLHVIEDAAHALGASLNGTPVGSYGEFACFSFYAIKNITTMEGGTVTLKDENVAATIRRLAANGMTATARSAPAALFLVSEVVAGSRAQAASGQRRE